MRSAGEGDKMKREDIHLLYEYNDWANQRILSTAAKLSAEQLQAANEWGWGSLHGMLAHILDAEYSWRHYLDDGEDVKWLGAQDFADLDAIRERWNAETRALRAYLDRLTDADLDGKIFYEVDGQKRFRILWHCLLHVVNHGTQHRSECAALLTAMGHSPGDLDFTVFLTQRSQGTSA
jgi:uncharacterized damage-inducible protein DinB